MAVVVLLIGLLHTGIGLGELKSGTRRPPRPRPISNAEWFEQRAAGIRHPHAVIPRREPAAVLFACWQAVAGVILIIDAAIRL